MKIKRKNKGITLIALVITIIVLLILAAVSIATLTGENGILNQAEKAAGETEKVEIIEKAKTDILGYQAKNKSGDISDEELKDVLNKYFDEVPDKLPTDLADLTLTTKPEYGGYDINISDIYNIDITSKVISENATEFYGKRVTGYEAGTGVTTWRIFYADDSNIYLIADDYISINDVPEGKKGNKPEIYGEGEDYKLCLKSVFQDYKEGRGWVYNNSKAKKWLSKYFNYTQDNGATYPNRTTPKPELSNIMAVAYIMDTNIWSIFANTDLAEYAIGDPTLDMFCESYKDTHERYIEYEYGIKTTNGYSVRWNDVKNPSEPESYANYVSQIPDEPEYNQIYRKIDNSKADGMWLASPSGFVDPAYLFSTNYNGVVCDSGYTGRLVGFRPIVCLKSNIQLEKVMEAKETTYKIK